MSLRVECWPAIAPSTCSESYSGSEREFGETANWRRLELFDLPGMAGIRIPALSGRSEAATGDDSLPGLWSLVSPSAPNRGNPIKPGGLTDSRSEPGKRPIDGKDSLLRSFRLRQPPQSRCGRASLGIRCQYRP